MLRLRGPSPLLVAVLAATVAPGANAHFLWITVHRGANEDLARSTVRTFLEEEPLPGLEKYLEHVAGVELFAHGGKLALATVESALEANWLGRLPHEIDAVRDMGITERKGTKYRLLYTARAQVGVAEESAADGDGLRVRMVRRGERAVLRVTFDGKTLPNARLMVYSESGEASESRADEHGLAELPGLAAGKGGVWANHVVKEPGSDARGDWSETRHYATLTFTPENVAPEATTFATIPAPAVNSFGGATLGDHLYVYSGHVGRMHEYDSTTTAKAFRRLDLRDGATWEDLPMATDLQGVALVSDGTALYRVGGMRAHNAPGTEEDTRSVAEFARFDPSTKTWTDLPPMPEPRSTHDAIVFENTLYVFGGWRLDGADGGSDYCTEALAFDLSRPDAGWRTFPQPFKRRALAVAEQGGKLYVLGGLQSNSKVAKRVDVFDPKSGAWSLGPQLPGDAEHEGFGPSAFSVSGRVYYSGACGVVFRLNEAGDAWDAVGAWSERRITHRLLPGRAGELLAVGGNHEKTQTSRIEALPVGSLADGSEVLPGPRSADAATGAPSH